MSTIRINIEDELYQAIMAIVKANGVSLSDSIAAYLRAVAETNSLVINTKLPAFSVLFPSATAEAEVRTKMPVTEREKKPENDNKQVLLPSDCLIPAVKAEKPAPAETTLPAEQADPAVEREEASQQEIAIPALEGRTLVDQFVALICAVPDGLLSTWEELEQLLSERSGQAIKKPLHDDWPRTVEIEGRSVAIPYWRILSWHGSTKGELTCTRDLREAMLTAEGYEIVTTARGFRVVRGYKKKLVRWVNT